jgi:hypothetical protein
MKVSEKLGTIAAATLRTNPATGKRIGKCLMRQTIFVII